jgi:hypothetical protein
VVSCDICGRKVFALSATGPSRCERIIACTDCLPGGWTAMVAVTPEGERRTLLIDTHGRAKRLVTTEGVDLSEVVADLAEMLSPKGDA